MQCAVCPLSPSTWAGLAPGSVSLSKQAGWRRQIKGFERRAKLFCCKYLFKGAVRKARLSLGLCWPLFWGRVSCPFDSRNIGSREPSWLFQLSRLMLQRSNLSCLLLQGLQANERRQLRGCQICFHLSGEQKPQELLQWRRSQMVGAGYGGLVGGVSTRRKLSPLCLLSCGQMTLGLGRARKALYPLPYYCISCFPFLLGFL